MDTLNALDLDTMELLEIIRHRPDLLAIALQLVTDAKQTGAAPPSEYGTQPTA